MMELQPLKIRFYPKLKSGTSDRYSLYMRMILSGKRTDLSMNYELKRESWDYREQMLKSKHPDRGYVLNLINQYQLRALEIYQQLVRYDSQFDVNTIRRKLTGDSIGSDSTQTTLLQLFERIVKRKSDLSGKNNCEATIQKYRRCKTHIQAYLETAYHMDDIKCSAINLQFVEDFEVYLKTTGCMLQIQKTKVFYLIGSTILF